MALTDWSAMAKGAKPGRDWYLASSLVVLGNEVNRRWPRRDTRSDGAIGDTSHQARKSDHNPDWDSNGVIRAIDIDKDGIDMQELLNALIGDPRVEYIIWNGRMMRSYSKVIDGVTYKPWQWAPYDGDNQHTGHAHVSIKHSLSAERDTTPWFTSSPPDPSPEEDPLSGITAADIGKAVADSLAPRFETLAARIDATEQKYTVADNRYDAQAAAWFSVANALAARKIEEAAAKGPLTTDVIKTIHGEVWSYLRPLWTVAE